MPEIAEELPFGSLQIASVLVMGVISGFVITLQPLLLGQLAAETKISFVQIGEAATLEALGMGLSASLAGLFLKPTRLRLIALSASLVSLLVNIVTAHISGQLVLAARFAAGASAGLLLWMWLGMLARAAVPARLAAIFMILQSIGVALLSLIFSTMLLPWGGADAGYDSIAAFYLIVLLLIPFSPSAYAKGRNLKKQAFPSLLGLLGLTAVLFQMAAVMAIWVYVLPLARQAGIPAQTAALAISSALGIQIIGSLLAALVAKKLRAVTALLLSLAFSLAGVVFLATAATAAMFLTAVGIIAFFWVFAPPFMMPYLLMIDPSRKAAMQMATAQLLGIAAGPVLASLAVTGSDVSGAIAVSAVMYILAMMLIFATMRV